MLKLFKSERISKPANRLLRDERGAGLVEYCMLAGLIAIAAFAAFRTFGENVSSAVGDQATQVQQIPTAE